MPLQTVTLSSGSVPGVSSPAFFSWRGGKPATASIFISTTSTSSAAVSLQFTLDDISLIGGTSVAAWQGWSSAPGQPTTVFSASTFADAGVEIPFQTPVTAVRLSATALTSGPLQLRVCQGEAW
jgi:hypothetical protein